MRGHPEGVTVREKYEGSLRGRNVKEKCEGSL